MEKQTNQQPEEELSGVEALKLDLYFWLQAAVMALVGLILLFTFVGRIIGVDGTSMVPTLQDRDMILLQSIGYAPKQNDVVVLTKSTAFINQPIVKRVIAVGGQTLDIDYEAGLVYVDGQPLAEPYLGEIMRQPASEFMTNNHITVPEGSIFVMGDNRNHSTDSRDIRLGLIDERCVLGRAHFVIFPFQDFGPIE